MEKNIIKIFGKEKRQNPYVILLSICLEKDEFSNTSLRPQAKEILEGVTEEKIFANVPNNEEKIMNLGGLLRGIIATRNLYVEKVEFPNDESDIAKKEVGGLSNNDLFVIRKVVQSILNNS